MKMKSGFNLNYYLLALALTQAGCVNSSVRFIKARSSGNATPTGYTHTITSATQIGGEIRATLQALPITTAPLTQFCSGYIQNSSEATRPCTCALSWTYSAGGSTVQQYSVWNVKTVDSGVNGNMFCAPPSGGGQPVIPSPGTRPITIRIAASGSGAAALNISPYIFNTSNSGSADLVDSDGLGINIIHRWGCFEKSRRGKTVRNRTQEITYGSQNQYTTRVFEGSRFCPAGDSGSIQECQFWGGGEVSTSSQSYYYNLYRKRQALSDIRENNDNYACPKVDRPFYFGYDSYYPLDSSFALWANPPGQDAVPVVAASLLGRSDLAGSGSAACGSTPGTPGNSQNLSSQCIGYAKKPNQDGSCGLVGVTVSSGGQVTTRLQPMRRLRRFVSLYPLTLSAASRVVEQSQAVDVVYTLDRIVDQSTVPQTPYATVRGPLPCLFAQLDNSGIGDKNAKRANSALFPAERAMLAWYNNEHQGVPKYYATNSSSIDGLNIDGTVLPYRDTLGFSPYGATDFSRASCSATIPLVFWDSANLRPTFMDLRTTNDNVESTAITRKIILGGKDNLLLPTRIPMGHADQWTPVYDEDTSFEACAPPALDPLTGDVAIVDPPIHTRVVGAKIPNPTPSTVLPQTMATWCAEVYPTQNGAVDDLESTSNSAFWPGGQKGGMVQNFTSHVAKRRSGGVQDCTPTVPNLPSGYPSASLLNNGFWTNRGIARHDAIHIIDSDVSGRANTTCDRTVAGRVNDIWNYPLLAGPESVEKSLEEFPHVYGCIYTSGRLKGKASPSGCCLYTESSPVGVAAHFEPNGTDTNCGVPVVPPDPP